ncbi:conserved hypothetical protein [Stutzerimonas stutzeri A1501]|uniref:Uncharacterized protein n=1 Tax=Stutzerimonas stutzeri (strain A1501) TaxID=379731 RepID=A4VIS5_STUS1|nr:conserved hypothetical protein [Stutzerimonas stutzeri A1501]
MNQLVGDHHLHFPLRHVLHLPGLPEKGLTAFQRTILSLPQHLPAAAVVGTDPASANRKHCFLDRFQMAVRNIETQLVHRTLHAGEPGGRQAVRWQLAINATTKRCGAS